MHSVRRITRPTRRSLAYVGLLGATTVTLIHVGSRYRDRVERDDIFSEHTRQQQKKHPFSGMHEPFITTDSKQMEIFQKNFPKFSFLIPTDVETMKQKHALKTPVKIKPLSECPVKSNVSITDGHTVVVGGPPAIITGVSLAKTEKHLTYINDERRIPIANGSAWHLEQDAETEGPTGYRPSRFLTDQIKRTAFGYVNHASVEKTGFFPWRTLDWIGWIRRPGHWISGLKLFFDYQWFVFTDDRQTRLRNIASQCVENEKFFAKLNQEFNGELLLQENGSIIVARTNEEVNDLNALKEALNGEGRTLKIIPKEEIMKRYGFTPNGLMYGEKVHDRVLASNFMNMFNNYIRQHGGKVIDGTLTTIYTDNQKAGGIAEYQTVDGQKQYVPFSRLIVSLGSQPIQNKSNKPLFSVIAARGVSFLANVYVPKGHRLPPVLVCGATNHATKLTDNPVSVKGDDGKPYDLYLMRFTGGACITPNVSDETTANYDASIAVGVLASVRNVLGSQCQIEPLSVYGCNRQVSRHGQTNWMEPYPGIHVQYGAGGGGLTRAPDFATRPVEVTQYL